MKVDLLLVVDHLNVECGIRYTYLRFIEWCDSSGISLALISDHTEHLPYASIKAKLSIMVSDQISGLALKRRPLYSVIEDGKLIHEDLCDHHEMCWDKAYWLDAWCGDRGWYPEVKRKCEEFIGNIDPKRVVIATQSFLGFTSESLLKEYNPAICLHTNYASFYAIRISGVENYLFEILDRASKNRIYKHFIKNKSNLFLNSKMSATFFEQTTKLDYKIFAPGVDTSLFQPDFQCSNKRIKILYTGRFSKEKGVDDLRQLIKSTPFVDWVLIGEMSEGYNLNFSHNAIYLGFLDQFRLAKEMSKSDLFVFYGKWDTFGMVALEALSCGLPVLAIKGSEIGRIVESNNCGGTFSTREELVELIMEFSKNGIDSEIQRNARFYAEKMTWGKSFGNFMEIL